MLYSKMEAKLTGLVAAGAGGSLVSGVLSAAAGWFYKAATDNCKELSIRQQVSESYLLKL